MRASVLLAIGLILSAPAMASQTPSSTRLADAAKLVKLLGVEGAGSTAGTVMADLMIRGNEALGPYRDVILKWANQYMSWTILGPKLASLYASAFTDAELRDLIQFYGSPTGRKAIAILPKLSRQGEAIGFQIAKAHLGALQAMIRARASELERLSTHSSKKH